MDAQTFEYQGETFDMADGMPVMLKEHETFTDKDRFMMAFELKDLQKQLEQGKHAFDDAAENIKNVLSEQAFKKLQTVWYANYFLRLNYLKLKTVGLTKEI